MDSDSVRDIDRRRLVTWGGLAAAGVAAGAPLVGTGIAHADSASPKLSGREQVPPDTRPGGGYDRYVARLAAEGKFSGVVLLSYRGRTSIYPDTGWVGVILSNCDGVPLLDICLREAEAITGAPVNPPGGG